MLAQFAGKDLPLWTSAKGAYSQPVAEHASLSRWPCCGCSPPGFGRPAGRPIAEGRSLFGLNVVIIGAGGIALELIRLLEPFGTHITVLRRSTDPVPGAERTVTSDQLSEVLPAADVVFVAAASTADTRHLIGAKELAAMKQTAVLVNVAAAR